MTQGENERWEYCAIVRGPPHGSGASGADAASGFATSRARILQPTFRRSTAATLRLDAPKAAALDLRSLDLAETGRSLPSDASRDQPSDDVWI